MAVVRQSGRGWAVVRGLDGLADYMCFCDPGPLGMWEDYRDGVGVGLEGFDEVVDVGA